LFVRDLDKGEVVSECGIIMMHLLAFPSSSMFFISLRDDEKTRFAHFSSESCKKHGRLLSDGLRKYIMIIPHSRVTLLKWPDA